jgi:hypothetical protein
MFDRAGDKGADGLGSGDFSGPASSVADNIVTFNGTTGKLGKDSGIKASDLIAGPASAVADNIATFNGTTGKIAKDSGIAVSSLAPKASPTFTGTPAAPTAAPGTNTTQVATTAFVKAVADLLAPLASPSLTGAPTGPTAAVGTNTTQLATTAFTQNAVAGAKGVAKAWVNFNGTGTVAILDSYNVSSITDNGTGDYTVNFTSALANANYAVVGAAEVDSGFPNEIRVVGVRNGGRATGSVRVKTGMPGSKYIDCPGVFIAIFGG